MKIGYACIPLGLEARTTRGFIIKNFNYENFCNAVEGNLKDLLEILKYNLSNNIHMFRISSDIIPFGSHEINNIEWEIIFKEKLLRIGEFIRENDIRVSMHPGQYTVLNALKEDVVKRAVSDIEYHTKFLDSLGVNYSNKVILHVGGAYGDKSASIERFKSNFKLLSKGVGKRLILENDEKSFNISEVIKICRNIKIPAVFDILHHNVNPCGQESIYSILSMVSDTWGKDDGNIKIHYSEQDRDKKLGSHSRSVGVKNFISFYEDIKEFNPDIMLEVKDKDISAIKCIYSLENNIKTLKRCDQWAKYKYVVMEKDYSLYKECSSIINSSSDMLEFYKTVDEALLKGYNEGNYRNTLQHVWGYFNNIASENEIREFLKLEYEDKDYPKAKKFLYRLSKKYNSQYLLQSYYFFY